MEQALNKSYWKTKSLVDFSTEEWEALCDGCGKCCLHKIEYADTGKIEYTNVACKLLNDTNCKCKDYNNRHKKISDCLVITPQKISTIKWLPDTCAYKLVGEGKDLFWWHHLKSGNHQSVHDAGVSIRGRTISEDEDVDLHDHVVDWIEKNDY